MPLPSNGDIIVVVPGILGSTLIRHGRETWSAKHAVLNIHRLSDRLTQDLALPADAFVDADRGYDDGTRPVALLPTQRIIPGLVAIDGYTELVQRLKRTFANDLNAISEFPYDWRQSNVYTASRLQHFIERQIDMRRSQGHEAAAAVVIAHSMGGLVAEYCVKILDERRYIRRVITVGTPFSGAVRALCVLANGFTSFGPFKLRIGELVRSLPSIAELLPVFPCVGSSPNQLAGIDAPGAVDGLSSKHLGRRLTFEKALQGAGECSAQAPIHAMLAFHQPTEAWAQQLDSGQLVAQLSTDMFDAGDGTVLRSAAIPRDALDPAAATFIHGRHTNLHKQAAALIQIVGVVTGGPRRPQAEFDAIEVRSESFVPPGEVCSILARAASGSDHHLLRAVVEDVSTVPAVVEALPLRSIGNGTYAGSFRLTKPGLYRWQVGSEIAATEPVDPISDLVLCADV